MTAIVSILTKEDEVNYLYLLNDDKYFNIKYILEKKTVAMRNCTSDGNLIDLQTLAKYLTDKPWVLLSVRQFKVGDLVVDVPVCQHCSTSQTTNFLAPNQTIANLQANLCIHSKLCSQNISRSSMMQHLTLQGCSKMRKQVKMRYWTN